MKHQMNLNPIPFSMIRSGNKTIELRLDDEKRNCIMIGDNIEFVNTQDTSILLVKVVGIYRYDSFEKLYETLPLLKCGYTSKDIHTAKVSDMDIYYSKEKQNQYGVVGIEIELAY